MRKTKFSGVCIPLEFRFKLFWLNRLSSPCLSGILVFYDYLTCPDRTKIRRWTRHLATLPHSNAILCISQEFDESISAVKVLPSSSSTHWFPISRVVAKWFRCLKSSVGLICVSLPSSFHILYTWYCWCTCIRKRTKNIYTNKVLKLLLH